MPNDNKNAVRHVLVLADTHNHLPPDLAGLAGGADEIWHLGDVCAPSLLLEIESVGLPVAIVRGNCDANYDWPLVVDLQRNGVRFRLVHIPPTRAPKDVEVLLHGHTHVPCDARIGGVRFLNPGCVTRPNRGAPASAAMLEIAADGKLTWSLRRLR